MTSRDYLGLHLRELPYFRSMVRAMEARFFMDIELLAPTLDLGCGDGHFATAAFFRSLDVGLDPGWRPILEASHRKGYRFLVQGDGLNIPFPSSFFASAVSNSVLEHIPKVQDVLSETARVLQPGARFVFCVPNQKFLPSLSIAHRLDRLGLSGAAQAYRAFFNRISRHLHCDSPETWQTRLEISGFQLDRWWHYFSPQALARMEWGHYFGLPSLLAHWITGKWILVPAAWNLAVTRQLVEKYLENPICPDGVYTMFISTRC